MKSSTVLIWLLTAFALSPIWGALLWMIWQGGIKPRLVPAADIEALADEMIARHGAHAEEAAFIEEDAAWRASVIFEQGRWRRVRHELRRRYEAGEWKEPANGV